jgi:hypothetical protein
VTPRRRLALALMLVLAVGLVVPAGGQPTSPVTARLILKNPPPSATYSLTQPVVIVVEVRNASASPVTVREGFSRTEFWRRLFFKAPDGRTIANRVSDIDEIPRSFFCLSRNGQLLRPTSTPVVPLEILAPSPPSPDPQPGFFVSFTIDDARKYYDLSRPGRYRVDARIPLQTFDVNPAALINDCDQLAGETVADVTAVQPGTAATVFSNMLEFVIGSPIRFGGLGRPLIDDDHCPNAARSPCVTVKLNRTLPVKFQLFDANNAPITTAHPRIVVSKVGGGTVTLPNDQFRFDTGDQQYIFNLHTQGLTPGVWQIDVIVDIDGSVHSAHVGLR